MFCSKRRSLTVLAKKNSCKGFFFLLFIRSQKNVLSCGHFYLLYGVVYQPKILNFTDIVASYFIFLYGQAFLKEKSSFCCIHCKLKVCHFILHKFDQTINFLCLVRGVQKMVLSLELNFASYFNWTHLILN